MREYEVVEANLPPEEHFHVDLVGVECAEEDLFRVEIIAPGDFGVELLDICEASDDACGAAMRLLAMESQFRALWFFNLFLLLLLLRLLLLLLLLVLWLLL